jgi:hypothetical protein
MNADTLREQYRYLRGLGAFGPQNCVPYISEEDFLQAQADFDRAQERKRWSPFLQSAMAVAERCDIVLVCHGSYRDHYLRQSKSCQILTGQIDLNGLNPDEREMVLLYLRHHLTAL